MNEITILSSLPHGGRVFLSVFYYLFAIGCSFRSMTNYMLWGEKLELLAYQGEGELRQSLQIDSRQLMVRAFVWSVLSTGFFIIAFVIQGSLDT